MAIRKDEQGRRIDEAGNLLPPHAPLGSGTSTIFPKPRIEPEPEPPRPEPEPWPEPEPERKQIPGVMIGGNPLPGLLAEISTKLDTIIGLMLAMARTLKADTTNDAA
jgi:hypothetical protein